MIWSQLFLPHLCFATLLVISLVLHPLLDVCKLVFKLLHHIKSLKLFITWRIGHLLYLVIHCSLMPIVLVAVHICNSCLLPSFSFLLWFIFDTDHCKRSLEVNRWQVSKHACLLLPHATFHIEMLEKNYPNAFFVLYGQALRVPTGSGFIFCFGFVHKLIPKLKPPFKLFTP